MHQHRIVPLLLIIGTAGCAPASRRATILFTSVAAKLGPDQVEIELNRAFVESIKDRVTIQASFTVDAAARSPNPASFDGDLHFAGRAPEIGLRLVGEIQNAASVEEIGKLLRQAESEGSPLSLRGAWRLWPEHATGPKQEQDQPVAPVTNANPDHVFELHPIIRLGHRNLLETLHPVEGYRPGSAKRTFAIYQGAEYKLRVTPTTIILATPPGLYNDVHFLMEIRGAQQVVSDGRFVMGAALDPDGTVLVEGLRMVFVKDSPPEQAVRQLRPGARLHVWGLPRVNLAELTRRVSQAEGNPERRSGKLPYEILILGIYPEGKP